MKSQSLFPTGISLLVITCLVSSFGGARTPTRTKAKRAGSLVGQIGFVSTRNGNSSIYLMDAQGTNQRPLAAVNTPSEEHSLSISRDGKTVVWSSNKPHKSDGGNFEIYIRRPNGTITSYTNDADSFAPDDTEPVISPDGKKIAWTTTRDDSKNIAVMSITGQGQTVLTASNDGEDSQPAWTNDSKKIAFYSERDGRRGVYIMDAKGANQRALLTSNANDANAARYFAPAFSPKGQLLAISAETASGTTISLINANGTKPSTSFKPKNTLSARSNASFSPDGKHLIYTASNGAGTQQIYSANLDGTNERALTSVGRNFEARFSN